MMRAFIAVAAGTVVLAGGYASELRGRGSFMRSGVPGIPATYDVEISTTGSFSEVTTPGCSTGSDRLVGSLTGDEPATAVEDVVYTGILQRTTAISFCHHKRLANGDEVPCNIDLTGSGSFRVELTIYPEVRRGGYMHATVVLPQTSAVTGGCDSAEMADLQRDYPTGSTAGSPDGQQIEDEYSADPPFYANGAISLPIGTYPPMPNSRGWTLRVLRKH